MAFLAILLTALALVPAGAHLLALPNKLAMPAEAYLAAQGAYAGWALAGALPIGALLANAVLAVGQWRRPAVRWPALAAAALLTAGLGVFFGWTFPANRATTNWTRLPPGWEALRDAWEWSHAGNAGLTLLALLAAIRAGLGAVSAPGSAGAGCRG